MNEIICPHCKKAFQVDDAGFAEILKQVHNQEFEKELHERIELFDRDKESAIKLAVANVKNEFQLQLAKKEAELAQLKADKNLEITELESNKESELTKLRAKINNADLEQKLAVAEAVNKIEKERDGLVSELKNKDAEKQLLETSLKEKHLFELKTKDDIIKMKDDEIAFRKDLKVKLSTKMIGETLEQHCETEFNKIRATGFQNAYFEKDNDSTSGSKGDYIYREFDETATKKKNEDFLRELDKDRKEKKCEYAVLVSLLEAENELYNTGIVDMSHRHAKLYIIRPQFFIPIITILRNAALNSLKYKAELALVRNQNIDITNFE